MRARTRRSMIMVVAMCILWVAATFSGMADLRIVQTTDGQRSETLYKNNRIASPMDGMMDSILMCETGELIMMAHDGNGGRYWVGSYDIFIESFRGLTDGSDGVMGGMGDAGGLGDLLGSLFGGESEDLSRLQVRVSKTGQDTVAGYTADHYVVETSTGGAWRVREEIWLSADLHREIAAEAGACLDHFTELQEGFSGAGGFGLDEMFRVIESPDYKALQEKGFTVRSQSSYPGLFGMTMDSTTELVEVSRDPISEEHFTIPANYERVEHFFGLISP